jgi:catalase-peroxidase
MTSDQHAGDISKCPVMGGKATSRKMANQDWWPNQLDIRVLHQNPPTSDPMGEGFDYAAAFKQLDLPAVKKISTR